MAAPPSKYGTHLPNMATSGTVDGSHVSSGMHMHHQRCVIREGVHVYVIIYYCYIVCALAAGTWRVGVARALGGTEWRGAGISDAADVATLRLTRAHTHIVIASGEGLCGGSGLVGADVVSLLSLTHARARVARRRCMGRARRCWCRRFGSVGGGEVGACCSDGGRGAAGARRGRGRGGTGARRARGEARVHRQCVRARAISRAADYYRLIVITGTVRQQ